MKRIFVAVVALCAVSPAFASGYGPAPFYRPDTGSPASQDGPSWHALAVERAERRAAEARDVGGVGTTDTASGYRASSWSDRSTFLHH